MKTIKFLTILFALIFGVAIGASAQNSDGTVTATPVSGKTNQWLFTMPASNVTLTPTYAKEAYAVLTGNGTDVNGNTTYTLTFYYDNIRDTRTDATYDMNTGTDVPGWYYDGNAITVVEFDPSFVDARPSSCYCWFSGCTSLTEIKNINNLKTDNVTNMWSMFASCKSLTSLNLSSFNTEKVTDMNNMFFQCSGLTSLNLTSFNTAVVTDMSNMFNGCSQLTTLDLSSFNTINVIGMSVMFNNCPKLTSLNLSNFNTANVTDMKSMFSGCYDLKSLNISSFNTENVIHMSNMFYGCMGLTSLELTSFNTKNVTDMSLMFNGCSGLSAILVGNNWSATKATDEVNLMFYGCRNLIGEKGTTYDANYTKTSYARIDDPVNGNPGYLSSAYTIIYNLDGGALPDGYTNYYQYAGDVASADYPLPTPTKGGFTFDGWTGSNGETPEKNVKISKGSTGNFHYTANWTQNYYTVTLPTGMEFHAPEGVTLPSDNKYAYNSTVYIKAKDGYKVTSATNDFTFTEKALSGGKTNTIVVSVTQANDIYSFTVPALASDNSLEVSATVKKLITKAEVMGRIATTRVYNGNVFATNKSGVQLDAQTYYFDEEAVSYDITAKFDDKYIGANKKITVTLSNQQGSSAYVLEAETFDIEDCKITLSETSYTVGRNADIYVLAAGSAGFDPNKTYTFVNSTNYSIEKDGNGLYHLKTSNDVSDGTYSIALKDGNEEVGKINVEVKDVTKDIFPDGQWYSSISVDIQTETEPETYYEYEVFNVTANKTTNTIKSPFGGMLNLECTSLANLPAGVNQNVPFVIQSSGDYIYSSTKHTINIDNTAPDAPKLMNGTEELSVDGRTYIPPSTTLKLTAADKVDKDAEGDPIPNSGIKQISYKLYKSGDTKPTDYTVSTGDEVNLPTFTNADDSYYVLLYYCIDNAGNNSPEKLANICVRNQYTVTLPPHTVFTDYYNNLIDVTVGLDGKRKSQFCKDETVYFRTEDGFGTYNDNGYDAFKSGDETTKLYPGIGVRNSLYYITMPAYDVDITGHPKKDVVITATLANFKFGDKPEPVITRTDGGKAISANDCAYSMHLVGASYSGSVGPLAETIWTTTSGKYDVYVYYETNDQFDDNGKLITDGEYGECTISNVTISALPVSIGISGITKTYDGEKTITTSKDKIVKQLIKNDGSTFDYGDKLSIEIIDNENDYPDDYDGTKYSYQYNNKDVSDDAQNINMTVKVSGEFYDGFEFGTAIYSEYGDYYYDVKVPASITPKKLSFTDFQSVLEDAVKTNGYDDATTITKTVQLTDNGIIDGDDVNATITGTYEDATPGNNKKISCSVTLDNSNYELDKTYFDVTNGVIKAAIKFDAGAYGTSETVYYAIGETIAGEDAPQLTIPDGYKLDYWKYNDEEWKFAENTVAGNMTLTPEVTGKKFTVRFDKNSDADDVEGEMPDQPFTYGTAQSLTTNTYTREGYLFNGWTNAEGREYSDGQDGCTLTTDGEITLYAIWESIEFIATYYKNGVKTTKDFSSLKTALQDEYTEADVDQGVTITQVHNNYSGDGGAVFTAKPLTLQLKKLSSSLTVSDPNSDVTIVEGCYFNGRIQASGGKLTIKGGTFENSTWSSLVCLDNGDVVLQGGTFRYTGSDNYAAIMNRTSKTSLLGTNCYYTSEDGTTRYLEKYEDINGDGYLYDGNQPTMVYLKEVTVTNLNTYTVTFYQYVKDGENGVKAQVFKTPLTVLHGERVTDPSSDNEYSTETKPGYEITYKWVDQNGDEWDFNNNTVKSDLELYPKLEPIEYKISYYGSNGGSKLTNTGNPDTYTIESKDIILNGATATEGSGKVFKCWKDAEGNDVAKITKGTIGDITLYAEWDKYNIDLYQSSITIYKSGNAIIDESGNTVHPVSKGQLAYRVTKNDVVLQEGVDDNPVVTVTPNVTSLTGNIKISSDTKVVNNNTKAPEYYTARRVEATEGTSGTITLSLPETYNCQPMSVSVNYVTLNEITAKLIDGTSVDPTKYYSANYYDATTERYKYIITVPKDYPCSGHSFVGSSSEEHFEITRTSDNEGNTTLTVTVSRSTMEPYRFTVESCNDNYEIAYIPFAEIIVNFKDNLIIEPLSTTSTTFGYGYKIPKHNLIKTIQREHGYLLDIDSDPLSYSYAVRNSNEYTPLSGNLSELTTEDPGNYTLKVVQTVGSEIAGEGTLDFTIEDRTVTDLSHTDETFCGKSDGTITVKKANVMEYAKEATAGVEPTSYTTITKTTLENLAPGTYYVRYFETDYYTASKPVEVTIAEGGKITVTYVSEYGDLSKESDEVCYETKVTKPTISGDDVKGHTFNGWKYEKNGESKYWNFDQDLVTENVTLTADWTTYTVTFSDIDENEGGIQSHLEFTNATKQKGEINDSEYSYMFASGTTNIQFQAKDGYKVVGDVTYEDDEGANHSLTPDDNGVYTIASMPAYDVDISATVKNLYTVTFNNNGHGTAQQQQSVMDGTLITLPTMTSNDGFTFEGWYLKGDKVTGNYTVKSKVEFTAKWNKQFSEEEISAIAAKILSDLNINKKKEYDGGVWVKTNDGAVLSDNSTGYTVTYSGIDMTISKIAYDNKNAEANKAITATFNPTSYTDTDGNTYTLPSANITVCSDGEIIAKAATVTFTNANALTSTYGETINLGNVIEYKTAKVLGNDNLGITFTNAALTSTTTTPDAGDYTITPSWTNTNYNVTFEPTKLTWKVNPAANTHTSAPEITDSDITHESIAGKNDGKISGVDDTMEYSTDGGGTYTSVPDGKTELSPLAPGVYLIRYKGDKNHEPSAPASVTINGGKIATSVDASDLSITCGDNINLSLSATASVDDEEINVPGTWTITLSETTETVTTVTTVGTVNERGVFVGTIDKSGTYTAQFTPSDADKYTTPAAVDFSVGYSKIPVSNYTATVTGAYTYTGSAIEPGKTSISITPNVVAESTPSFTSSDYDIKSYTNNVNAGTAQVTISGTGCFSGELTADFTISPMKISANDVTITVNGGQPLTYTGRKQEPGVEVKIGDKTLVPNTDYKVEYDNNTDAGETAVVKIVGVENGNYTFDNVSETFTIKPAKLSAPDANVVKANPPSVIGKPDGSIVGVTLDMEYSTGAKDEQGNYIYNSVTGTSITGLKPGVYYVRYAADDNHDASEELTLEVEESKTLLTMTFASNGGSSVDNGTAEYNQVITEPEVPTRTGYAFKGWFTDNEEFKNQWNFSTALTENVTLYAKWEINQYTITFDTDGGSEVASITQDYNTSITKPGNPTKTGHTFDGWDTEIPSTMPAGDVTIKANWKVNEYTVTFNSNGGSTVDSKKVNYNSAVSAPGAPTKEGNTFGGWYTDNGTFQNSWNFQNDKVEDNMTLYAKWTVNKYKLTFNADNGSSVTVIEQEFGSAITKPQDPKKEGHSFEYWMVNNVKTDIPSTMPAENMAFTAKWKVNEYTIVFHLDNGEGDVTYTLPFGSPITAPMGLTRENYTFDCWDKTIPATMPVSDQPIEITALWIEDGKYTIKFVTETDEHDEVVVWTSQSYYDDETIDYTGFDNPSRDGYSFDGWYVLENDVKKDLGSLPTTMPEGGLTVYAKWTAKKYTVQYETNGGTAITPVSGLTYNSAIPQPGDPSKEGHSFSGWFTDMALNTPCDFTNGKVTDNMTLYAKWDVNTYTVIFQNYDGALLGDPLTYEYGDKPKYTGNTPEKIGEGVEYTFTGWADDQGKTFAKNAELPKVTRDVTYTAMFSDRETVPPTVSVTIDGKPVIDPETQKPVVIECIGSAMVNIDASDDSGIATKTYQIDGGESIAIDGDSFAINEQQDVTRTITIVVTDKNGNPTTVEANVVIRQEASFPQGASYTYTQRSKKDVVLEGLDLHGATITKITIDGKETTLPFVQDGNNVKLNSGEVLDNVNVGDHTLQIYTKLNNDEEHPTNATATLTVNGFLVDFTQSGEKADGYCNDENAVITLAFDQMDQYPTHYKIVGIHEKFVPMESLVNEIAKIKVAITGDMPLVNGNLQIQFAYTDGTPNTESEVKDLSIKINGSSDLIIELFEDILAIDNHDDLYTAFQWYKDGVEIEGATQQYYQSQQLQGRYGAYVTTTDGKTLNICPIEVGKSVSKSLKHSVNVYPNPARAYEEVTIELLNFADVEYEGCVIRIVNALGATAATINNCDRINTVSLPSGTYTGYVIRNGKDDKVSFKLIVK